jgi:DNA invertase Pin-like site-specific DNA recombinase
MTKPLIGYRRVSTREQGRSGLGLEAQTAAVEAYAASRSAQILAWYEDVQSGADRTRPGLERALTACKQYRAKLIVAKLDRLSRDVEVIAGLMNRVDFGCADMPEADRFQLHVYAALAEQERKAIGQRTRAALAAAKRRGIKLGNPKGTAGAARAAAAERQAAARAYAESIRAKIELCRKQCGEDLSALARSLTTFAVPTARGKTTWHPMQVKRLLALLQSAG